MIDGDATYSRLVVARAVLFVCLPALSQCTGEPDLARGATFLAQELRPVDRRAVDRTGGQRALQVLSYNVFLRPPPVGWGDDTTCRARAIGEQLVRRADRPTVVALNESFASGPFRTLLAGLDSKFPHRIRRRPRHSPVTTNGGLSLLSTEPIERFRTRTFDACNGTDCLADKGFVHAQIRLGPGTKINIVATHLDAGGQPADRRARARQLRSIRRYLSTNAIFGRWPTVLTGDLNVDGLRHPVGSAPPSRETSEYTRMLTALAGWCPGSRAPCASRPTDAYRRTRPPWPFDERGTRGVGTHPGLEPTPPHSHAHARSDWRQRRRLDYVLAFDRPSRSHGLGLHVSRSRHLSFHDDRCGHTRLSDHRAVTAEVRFERF
ncbi:MAG: hypothetical protein ABEL76_14915 [Bradymonadaceae bacterium]